MLRLIHERNRERGAVAVIVGLVVGMFVLTGVAALTIDAGRVYAERRVLQNGADAAALALAQICAVNSADPKCANTADLTALAGANAADDHLTSISICGSGTDAAKFGECPTEAELAANRAAGATLIDCPALPASLPADVNYVEVRTRTLSNSSDSSKVSGVFGGLKGGASIGKTVQACARAAWGPATRGPSTIPLTISKCEWDRHYSSSTPPPPYATPFPVAASTWQVTLYFHDTTGANGCDPTPSGFDLPGGFGYLDGGACEVPIQPDLWYGAHPGDGYPSLGCDFKNPSIVGTVVYIPIFIHTNGLTGNNIEYKLDGVAAFFVTGFRVSGSAPSKNQKSIVTHDYPGCSSSSQTCLFGWFTHEYMPAGEFDFGDTGTPRGAIGAGYAG